MYKIVDALLNYGIPTVGAISLLLLNLWRAKIGRYLKVNHPDIHYRIYVTKQEEYRDDEEWSLFSEFISEKYKALSDNQLSEIIYTYKLFRFSVLIFMLLFFVNIFL